MYVGNVCTKMTFSSYLHFYIYIIQIVDGHASIKLQTKDFQLKAEESNVTDLEGCQLYIAVTALEKASKSCKQSQTH